MSDKKVKLNNDNSRFAQKAELEKIERKNFENQVEEHLKTESELAKKISELGSQYMNLIKDKTLNENKGPIQLEIEKSLPKEMASLSLDLNNDQTQAEGVGSIGLILILLKVSLLQRDLINELSYEVYKLKNSSS